MQVAIPHPSHKTARFLFIIVMVGMVGSMLLLATVGDTVRLKALIEDDGPVQMTGQIAITITFVIALLYSVFDKQRRTSFLMLSYILMFYTLREADYHYKVSEHAKASQIKRFFSHELIPISTKLFLASIIILLLVVLFRYIRREKDNFRRALEQRLPWALFVLAWVIVAGMSQFIDQVPVFHTVYGQVVEEVLEASAEVLALLAIILFGIQVSASARDRSPAS